MDVATFRRTGALMVSSNESKEFIDRMVPSLKSSGIAFDTLSREALESEFGAQSRFGFDFGPFGPPKRIDDATFGVRNHADRVEGGVFMKESGYIADPQLATENFRMAAENTSRATFHFKSKVIQNVHLLSWL